MSIFDFKDAEALGTVQTVDTATVVVHVRDIEHLRQLQVNRLAVLQSSKAGQHLVGIIQRITRTAAAALENEADSEAAGLDAATAELNLVKIVLIGTLISKVGMETNVFRRTLETVPEIGANCFAVEGERLAKFMQAISQISNENTRLSLGHYTLDEKAEAFLNGNKLFQRHLVVVGSTGAGKSWTTARLLEQVAALPNANAIVFDLHDEYATLVGDGFRHFRIAGTTDLDTKGTQRDGVVFLPYWLLGYEALIAMFVDRSDQNAPNQAMVMSRAIVEAKRAYLEKEGRKDVLENFTIDSPIPFSLDAVVTELKRLNDEMTTGSSGREKQGELHGKLGRLIQRLESKRSDRRLGFLFRAGEEAMKYDWLDTLAQELLEGGASRPGGKGGVKVIDFSEVPSDILPLIVSLVGRLVFSAHQWMPASARHPIALFCDEAHLYIPNDNRDSGLGEVAGAVFERIAKEGRKYGIGLVVISQRPSEVNRTILSQCNNLITMRLTNGEDQAVVRRLLPDSLGGFAEILPVLDTGEALVVGDASLLPSRIRVSAPSMKPSSGTIEFWDKWSEAGVKKGVVASIEGWRKQSAQE